MRDKNVRYEVRVNAQRLSFFSQRDGWEDPQQRFPASRAKASVY